MRILWIEDKQDILAQQWFSLFYNDHQIIPLKSFGESYECIHNNL